MLVSQIIIEEAFSCEVSIFSYLFNYEPLLKKLFNENWKKNFPQI